MDSEPDGLSLDGSTTTIAERLANGIGAGAAPAVAGAPTSGSGSSGSSSMPSCLGGVEHGSQPYYVTPGSSSDDAPAAALGSGAGSMAMPGSSGQSAAMQRLGSSPPTEQCQGGDSSCLSTPDRSSPCSGPVAVQGSPDAEQLALWGSGGNRWGLPEDRLDQLTSADHDWERAILDHLQLQLQDCGPQLALELLPAAAAPELATPVRGQEPRLACRCLEEAPAMDS